MAVCAQRQRLQIAAAQHAAKRLIRRAFIKADQQISGIGRKSVVYVSLRIGWKSQQKGVFQAKMLQISVNAPHALQIGGDGQAEGIIQRAVAVLREHAVVVLA